MCCHHQIQPTFSFGFVRKFGTAYIKDCRPKSLIALHQGGQFFDNELS